MRGLTGAVGRIKSRTASRSCSSWIPPRYWEAPNYAPTPRGPPLPPQFAPPGPTFSPPRTAESPPAPRIYQEMKAPDSSDAFSALISSLFSRGLFQEVDQVFRGIRSAQIFVSVPTYRTFIDIYGQLRDFDRMDMVYTEMKRAMMKLAGHQLPEQTPQQKQEASDCFATLLDSCYRRGLFQEVQQVYKAMKVAQLTISVPTYKLLIESYSQLKNWGEMDTVYMEMKEVIRKTGVGAGPGQGVLQFPQQQQFPPFLPPQPPAPLQFAGIPFAMSAPPPPPYQGVHPQNPQFGPPPPQLQGNHPPPQLQGSHPQFVPGSQPQGNHPQFMPGNHPQGHPPRNHPQGHPPQFMPGNQPPQGSHPQFMPGNQPQHPQFIPPHPQQLQASHPQHPQFVPPPPPPHLQHLPPQVQTGTVPPVVSPVYEAADAEEETREESDEESEDETREDEVSMTTTTTTTTIEISEVESEERQQVEDEEQVSEDETSQAATEEDGDEARAQVENVDEEEGHEEENEEVHVVKIDEKLETQKLVESTG